MRFEQAKLCASRTAKLTGQYGTVGRAACCRYKTHLAPHRLEARGDGD